MSTGELVGIRFVQDNGNKMKNIKNMKAISIEMKKGKFVGVVRDLETNKKYTFKSEAELLTIIEKIRSK